MRTGTAIAVCVTMFTSACVVAAGTVIATQYVSTPQHSALDYAMASCEYGSAMFYVGRGIDPVEAEELATSDCASYLTTRGEDYMIDFYGVDW